MCLKSFAVCERLSTRRSSPFLSSRASSSLSPIYEYWISIFHQACFLDNLQQHSEKWNHYSEVSYGGLRFGDNLLSILRAILLFIILHLGVVFCWVVYQDHWVGQRGFELVVIEVVDGFKIVASSSSILVRDVLSQLLVLLLHLLSDRYLLFILCLQLTCFFKIIDWKPLAGRLIPFQ